MNTRGAIDAPFSHAQTDKNAHCQPAKGLTELHEPFTSSPKSMNELAWLVGHQLLAVTRREYDWTLTFDDQAGIVIECLWRLLAHG